MDAAIAGGAAVADDAAIAGDAAVAGAELANACEELAALTASQTDEVHHARATIASLESVLEGLRAIGSVRGAHGIEQELLKERRRERQIVGESPAVADAFCRLRKAEAEGDAIQIRKSASPGSPRPGRPHA